MAGAVFQVSVSVTDECLRREQSMALRTLYTASTAVSIQLGHAHALALAETLVVYLDLEGRMLVQQPGGSSAVQEGAAQTLGIRLGDEAAGRSRRRQYTRHFQFLQLFRITTGAENLQLVADLVDLRQTEVS